MTPQKIRLLGIAPYEGMRGMMVSLAREYKEIELTAFVGDLQQGVELARRNFYNDYDAIISRGGTTTMLRERLDLPVIDIPVSSFDLLRAMKLAENVSDHYAIVGFSNVTANAKNLCQLTQDKIDIYTITRASEVEETLLSIRSKGTQAILCDMVAHTAAIRLGLNVVLITSSAEEIRSAFTQAIWLYRNYSHLREENRFLRRLIWNQINHTVVFNMQGELFFSTLEDNCDPILGFLKEESLRALSGAQRNILKQINNVQYSIRMRHEMLGQKEYVAYYFSKRRVPPGDIQRGIRYVGQPEAEEQYKNSLYGCTGLFRDLQKQIAQINRYDQPLMVCGEDGTCKEQAVNYLYLQSNRRNKPLIIIDSFMLDEKAWSYLIDHHNSPLVQDNCTIFVKNVDILPREWRRQLLASMLDMNICKRNRLIFSCVCKMDETYTEAGMEFVEAMSCLTLYLPPLRQRAAQMPAAVNMYLNYLNSTMDKPVMGLMPGAMQQMQAFGWRHNYTQFQRVLKELVLMAEGPYITEQETAQLLQQERTIATVNAMAEDAGSPLDLSQPLNAINREIARRVLSEENGNQSSTALRLGISRTTLWRLLRD